jgi:streptogramin lyase
LWFTEFYAGKIGCMTTAGALCGEFLISGSGPEPEGITLGPDNNIWFTVTFSGGAGAIGCIMTSVTGTEGHFCGIYPTKTIDSGPRDITVGSDGNLWFTEINASQIGCMTTKGNFCPTVAASSTCNAFAECQTSTPSSGPWGITTGPDGDIWYTENETDNIGCITTAGVACAEYSTSPYVGPIGIIYVPSSGELWFAARNSDAIGQMNVSGVITPTQLPDGSPYPKPDPYYITMGPDGVPWFTENSPAANAIGSLQPTNNTHDFNGDKKSDILFQNTSGAVALWLMNGGSILNSEGLGTIANTYSIIGLRDFTGGGDADILWRDSSGNLYMWFMKGLTVSSTTDFGNVPTTWTVYGTADMNSDVKGDILWQNTSTGEVAIWFMNGSTVTSTAVLGTVSPSTWSIIGSAAGTILWRDTSGDLALWQVNGSSVHSGALGTVPSNWQVVGLGDFNGDGIPDILWRDSTSGTVAIWFLNSSGHVQSTASVGAVPISSGWIILETGDYNGDGKSDILWTDSSGDLAVWFMNGSTVASTAGLGNVGTSWVVQTLNAD